jgi:hypothetical protein
LDLLAFVIAGLISTAKIEKKYDTNNTKLATYISGDYNPSVTRVRTFSLGDSVQQTEEKAIRERQVASEKLLQRGESYSGTGSQVEIVSKDTINNCVKWAKIQTGKSGTVGAGGRQGINTQDARVGEMGVVKGKIPHAVVIEKVEGEKITILESNYYRGYITRRVLSRSEFLGFVI